MPVKLGGSAGGGEATEMTLTASGTVSAGDGIIIQSNGKGKKAAGNISDGVQTESAATWTHNEGSAWYPYGDLYRMDAENQRACWLAHAFSQTNGQTYIFPQTVATTGAYVSSTTNATLLGNMGAGDQVILDAIWDQTNTAWLIALRNSSDQLQFARFKTTDGTTGTVYMSTGTADPYATANRAYHGVLVKDASGRIYYCCRGGSNDRGSRVQQVNYSSDSTAADAATLGTAVTSSQVHANNTSEWHTACYDAENDQILTMTGAADNNANIILTAFDIDGSGALSESHYRVMTINNDLAGSELAQGSDYPQVVSMAATNGRIACQCRFGAAITLTNTGSAFTAGKVKDGVWGSYATGVTRIMGLHVLNGVADQFAGFYTKNSSTSDGLETTIYKVVFSVDSGGNPVSLKETVAGAATTYGASARGRPFDLQSDAENHVSVTGFGGTGNYLMYPNLKATTNKMRFHSISASDFDMKLLAGSAKTGASNGSTFTLNIPGATQTTSGKIPGAKYFFNSIGTLVENKPTTSPFSFYGTALSATEINVGRDIQVATPDSDANLYNTVPKALTSPGFTTQVISYPWYTTLERGGVTYSTVSASGSSTILEVQGTGTVLYFIMSAAATSVSNINVDIFFDGELVANTGTIATEDHRPISIIGDFHGRLNGTGHGNYLTTNTAHSFNSSFEVRRNSASAATSFWIAYKIVET